LEPAGIKIDATNPFDIHVHNPDFHSEVLAGGSVALGESYMDGWWDSDALDPFFYRVMGARLDRKVRASKTVLWEGLKAGLYQKTSWGKAVEIGRRGITISETICSPSCWTGK
jgi:cyclopropane-fatty-acyl-phospholipid synthase